MKVALASDLHLEFGKILLENKDNADVLILSGDVCVAEDIINSDPYGIIDNARYNRILEFFENVSNNFPKVFYVMGNHEHYHGDFSNTAKKLKSFLKPFRNIHLLDKEFIEVDNFIFYGGTLWTNFDIGYGPRDEGVMRSVTWRMNDYRQIKNSNKKTFREIKEQEFDSEGNVVNKKIEFVPTFTTEDSYEDHNLFIDGLKKVMCENPDKKIVVIGHHSPSKQSTHPRYKHEVEINSAYSSDLDDFILDNQNQLIAWTHGHTHHTFCYNVGTVTIFCNPRGYDGYEQRADDFKLLTFDIVDGIAYPNGTWSD